MAAIQCRDCISGSIHRGKPAGTEIEFHGLSTYVARPEEGTPEKGIIVFIPDMFGWKFANSRLLADKYAKKGGYVVYLPDFMRGYGAAPKAPKAMRFAAAYSKPSSLLYTIFIKPFYLIASLLLLAGEAYHTRRSKSRPIVFDFMRRLRADPATADTKIGVAGFCWGGQYAILLGQNDSGPGSSESKSLVDSVFTAHPARFEIPSDVEKVKVPLSMALASNDLWVSQKEARILEKVEKKELYEAVVFYGTTHGFALRNDEVNEVEVAAAEKAEEQALSWFKKWIG